MKNARLRFTVLASLLAWIATANLAALRSNFSDGGNIGASPLIVGFENISGNALHRWFETRTGISSGNLVKSLDHVGDRFSLTLTAGTVIPHGSIDYFSQDDGKYSIVGWIYADDNVMQHLIIEDKASGKVLGAGIIDGARPDVMAVFKTPNAERTGFKVTFKSSSLLGRCDVRYYLVSQKMIIREFLGTCANSEQKGSDK